MNFEFAKYQGQNNRISANLRNELISQLSTVFLGRGPKFFSNHACKGGAPNQNTIIGAIRRVVIFSRQMPFCAEGAKRHY